MPLNKEEKALLQKANSELNFPGNFPGGVFEAYQFGRAQVFDMLARIELASATKAPQAQPPEQTSKTPKKKKRKAK